MGIGRFGVLIMVKCEVCDENDATLLVSSGDLAHKICYDCDKMFPGVLWTCKSLTHTGLGR